jgi:hypothetical protein
VSGDSQRHRRTERERQQLTIDVLLGELVAGGVELLLFLFLFSSLYKCKPLTLIEKDAQMSGLNLLYYTCRQKMLQAYIHVEGGQGCSFVLQLVARRRLLRALKDGNKSEVAATYGTRG